MDRENVNNAKGCRRCRGRILVRLEALSHGNFILRKCASRAVMAGKRDSETDSSTSRSPWGVRLPGASVKGCGNPEAWRTSTIISHRRNSLALF